MKRFMFKILPASAYASLEVMWSSAEADVEREMAREATWNFMFDTGGEGEGGVKIQGVVGS